MFLPCADLCCISSYYGVFMARFLLGWARYFRYSTCIRQKFAFLKGAATFSKFSRIRKIANIGLGTGWLETLFYLTNPVFPGGSFGYVLSFSSIKIRDVMFKLLVCTIPGSILTAGLGAKSLDLFRDKTWLASRDFIFILACFLSFSFIIRRLKAKHVIGGETDE